MSKHRSWQGTDRTKRGVDYCDNDLVFCKENGEPLNPQTFSKAFERQDNLQFQNFQGNLQHVEPTVAQSALKHGLDREDVLHAFNNPIRSELVQVDFVMLIGASRSAALLEIGVVEGEDGSVIVHAMSARTKYLR